MIREVLDDLFTRELLDAHPDEWGFAGIATIPLRRAMRPRLRRRRYGRRSIGMWMSLSHTTMHGISCSSSGDEVQSLLRKHGLTHIWAHLPLDLADFGTSAMLLSEIGCTPVATLAEDAEGWANYPNPQPGHGALKPHVSAVRRALQSA